jgi:anti-anti-sigma factor
MDVTVQEFNRVDLIKVAGRIDSSTAPQLGETFNARFDAGTNNLVLDLFEVDYMSSAGLREMVAALKRAKQGGGDLRLCTPSERVVEVLDLAGLDSIFQVFDDQVAAVGSF